MENTFAHYCQRCRAANPPGETSCYKCGTRLMIVTFPANLRLEEEAIPPSYYEDHLLERVSLLEFKLKQVTEQLTMAYEFISRQSENFETDHLLITSFMESVSKIEPLYSDRLAEEFTKNYKRNKGKLETSNKQQQVFEEILSNHEHQNTELFSHLMQEGLRLLEENEEKQAFQTLERAKLLSPKNIPLLLFIAEKLFFADKFDLAKKYLTDVFEIFPQNIKSLLLLGIIYADENEAEKSRKFLSVLAGNPKTMVCANYIWGVLSASEGNWNEAIIAFKESSEYQTAAELDYLIGSAYFQISNFSMALEYLESAVLEEARFADAWFMISEIYRQLEKPTKSENARQMVFEAKEAGAICLKFMSKKNVTALKTAIPFLHLNEKDSRLLFNGSLRMREFFRELIFDSIE